MSKSLIVTLCTLLLVGVFAIKVSSLDHSSTSDRLYSKEACIEDLNRIAQEIKNTHPSPFDYISKSDFELKLQAQISQLKEENTLRDFHWIARKLIATIGCGHTALNGQNEERAISDSLHFPLETRFVGDQLFITQKDDRYPNLKVGTEIKNINGQNVKSMLRNMMQRISSDGLNDAYPRFYINREVDFFIENEFQHPEFYSLILSENGTSHKATLPSGKSDWVDPAMKATNTQNLDFNLDHDNDLAVMTIRSFNYYGVNYNQFTSFVDKSMSELMNTKIKNLIVDIRGNGGGDPNCANHLLRYISKTPYQYFHEKNMGYPDLKKEIHPFDHAFPGKTFMIIDGGCGSTSGHLASIVKYNKTATLVGQTTGATYKCHDNSGDITLPNTKLNLHIARMTFETAVEDMDMSKGVVPDIFIEKTLDDWISEKDSVIDSIYQIIRRSK